MVLCEKPFRIRHRMNVRTSPGSCRSASMIRRKRSWRKPGSWKRSSVPARSIAGRWNRSPRRKYGGRLGLCSGDLSVPSRGGGGASRDGGLVRESESRAWCPVSCGVRAGVEAGMRGSVSHPIDRRHDVRRARMRRPPFTILYREVGGRVEILAVAHHRRRPAYWLIRLQPPPVQDG